jgi:hypothetical protein
VTDEQSLKRLEEEIEAAQSALLATANTRPDEWWDARVLRDQARNSWAGDVMSFALTDLVNRDAFELNPWLKVRPKTQ